MDERGLNKFPEVYRSLENWPKVDETRIDRVEDRRRFARLRKAVEIYLSTGNAKDAARAAELSVRRFYRLIERCLSLHEDRKIWGERALIFGARVNRLRRRANFKPSENPKAGFQGLFNKLFEDHPEIEAALVEKLLPRGPGVPRMNEKTFRQIHREFRKSCLNHGIGDSEYPLNTKECGRRALKTWIQTKFMERYGNRWIAAEYGPSASQSHAYSGGDGESERLCLPFDEWQFDEVKIDVEAKYCFPNAYGSWDELALRSSKLIRAIDVGSGAKLANRLVISPEATAEDISILLWRAVSGTTDPGRGPINDLKPMDGAGYPAVVVPDLRFAVPKRVKLDNALAHLADHVQHTISHLWGGQVHLGPPGTPQERAEIEADFSAQARKLVRRLPGATGSGPTDPLRKTASVAVEERIDVAALEQVICVYSVNQNVVSASASGYISPLERLRRQLASGALKPVFIHSSKRAAHFFGKATPVFVKGSIAEGRRPFVNYMYERYQNNLLAKSWALVGSRLWARADFENIQTIWLFREDGTEFGPVSVLGKWGKFPHDVRIRKLYGKLKREGLLGEHAEDEPLDALFGYLEERATHDRTAAQQLTYIVEYLRGRFFHSERVAHSVEAYDSLQNALDKHSVLPIMDPANDESADSGLTNRPRSARTPQNHISSSVPSEDSTISRDPIALESGEPLLKKQDLPSRIKRR